MKYAKNFESVFSVLSLKIKNHCVDCPHLTQMDCVFSDNCPYTRRSRDKNEVDASAPCPKQASQLSMARRSLS